MNDLVYIFCESADVLLQAVVWLYFLRCILRLMGADEEFPLMYFAVMITEVFITPVRIIFERLGYEDFIIDIPGMIAIFIVATVDMFL